MIAGTWAAFAASGVITKLIAIGSLLLILAGAYGIWHHHVWSNGYSDALAAIARQDAKAIARATEYRNDFKNCRAKGLRWDQATGRCS